MVPKHKLDSSDSQVMIYDSIRATAFWLFGSPQSLQKTDASSLTAGLAGRYTDDMALAARPGVGIPRTVSTRGSLDDGRIAERWWLT